MTSTSGGEAIVNGLVAHGVDTVFGLPGAQIYGLFDAFHQAQLKVIGARHEQAAAYMALGYARATGKPGVFSVVPGPGVLNASAALLTAMGRNEPVLCLTGQVPTRSSARAAATCTRCRTSPPRCAPREMGGAHRISRDAPAMIGKRVPGDAGRPPRPRVPGDALGHVHQPPNRHGPHAFDPGPPPAPDPGA